MSLIDAGPRERIRTALDVNVIVEAAAGTGKTTELVRRMVAVLAHGNARVERIVAVTFTEKAAGELKLRLRTELEHARRVTTEPTQRSNLEDALARLEEAWVGTIHGFCADLLRERSVEAEVDPQFVTMTEPESQRLYREAFQLWLQEKLEDPPEGVRRSLRRTSSYGSDGPVGRLRQAGWTLVGWRDFPAPWRRDVFSREERIDGLVDRLHAFADVTRRAANTRDGFFTDTLAVRRWSDAVRTAEAVRDRDHDGLEASLIELAFHRKFKKPRKGRGQFAEGVKRAEIHEAHDEVVHALQIFAVGADADLAALLQEELQEPVERYELLKQRSGRVDFVDLLLRARNLVRDREDVRREFQSRFTHLFVDEFQDTDPLQAEIILLLAAEDPAERDWRQVEPSPGKLFLVGDPKQSIYRFRRADVGIYLEVRDLLVARGAECVELSTSFRSAPSIQRAVNEAFGPLMDGDPASQQASYVPLAPFRKDPVHRPTVVALPVPEPYGYRQVAHSAVEASLPHAVGAYVHWLIEESGWTVTEREGKGEPVPIAPRHVCLLFRRFDSFFAGDITRPYVQALESRGIRHLLVGGRSFHEREEVDTVRTALSAIEWPDDELAVYATLRGSLFAVGDEALLEYRHRHGRLHPFRVPDESFPADLEPIARALETLAVLHRRRNHRPIAESIRLLLEGTRAHAGFVLRPSGEQALANVLHVAEQARTYENAGGLSFRGFVEQLLQDADGGRTAEAPILEEGSEGVRLMTVHKAKGLEFPIVILADITANLTPRSASRTIDPARGLCAMRLAGWSPAELLERESDELRRDQAEAIRVAYVAATRARDLLVVPGVGDGPLEAGRCWISPLDPSIYPSRENWSRPEPAVGCPEFGEETVLSRPDAFFTGGIRPGRHEVLGGSVVWWDPARLELQVPALYGVRQADLIGKETAASVVEADVARHQKWREEHDGVRAAASRKSLEVVTATEWARNTDGPADGVETIELEREATRSVGPRFGSLVHATLATVALDADPETIDRGTRLQARILGATDEEAANATECVTRVLEHPLFARAREAKTRGECRRETPITLKLDEARVVEGVADLAFREADGWTVVDFKTDRDLGPELASYRRQVDLYARAIAAATGEPCRAVIVRV